jgi:hypothetical protein
MSANTFRWYKKPAFDAPHLNSPQPCSHGAGCNYRVTKDGVETIGCCAFVHPGEEGNGRRLFEERTSTNEAGETVVQKACVRLTGRAGFYERRRLRLSWPAWCERQRIPYTPNPTVEVTKPVVIKAADRLAAAQALLSLMNTHGIAGCPEINQIERALGVDIKAAIEEAVVEVAIAEAVDVEAAAEADTEAVVSAVAEAVLAE